MSMNNEILHITHDSFQKDVVEDSSPILIDFWAPWCGPCKSLAPILEKVAEDLNGKVRVAKVNVDEEPALSEAFQIRGIPALALIKDRKIIDMITGLMPRDAIVKRVLAKLA